MTRMPFGKHRGRLLSALPLEYLEWLVEQRFVRQPLASRIKVEYERRLAEERTEIVTAELLKAANDIVSTGFRALAVKHHPDRGGDHHKMAQLNSAVEFLRRGLEREVLP